jgi:hypothetical protein
VSISHSVVIALLLLCMSICGVFHRPCHAATPSFEGLGHLSDTFASSIATTVSGDGSTIYGESGASVFRWTRSGGMQVLESGSLVRPSTASFDGSVVVGTPILVGVTPFPAVRWDVTVTGAVNQSVLSLPEGFYRAEVSGISSSGQVTVGTVWDDAGPQAYRWLPGIDAPVPVPGRSVATGTSGDGTMIVGYAYDTDAINRGFLWTEAEGTQWIVSPDANTETFLSSVSADGATVIGGHQPLGENSEGKFAPFRWTESRGTQSLGALPAGDWVGALPISISGDGSVIIGVLVRPDDGGSSGDWMVPMIWDEGHGMRTLKSALEAEYGLDLGGWVLGRAMDISADGNTIVGYGIDPQGNDQAWVVTLPEPAIALAIFVAPLLIRRRRWRCVRQRTLR